MNLIILVSILTLVNCRPQAPGTTPDNVQIEKQEVQLLKEAEPANLKLVNGTNQNTTNEILDKITRISHDQGSKAKESEINPRSLQRYRNSKQQFQFSENPYYNPIFDYINRNPIKKEEIVSQNFQSKDGYGITHTNPKITTDDIIPGQYIKRKVTHQQTMIIPMESYPNINYYNPNNYQQLPYPFPNQQQFYRNPQVSHKPVPEDVKETLENQTIENVKNIVNTQVYPSFGYHNQFIPYPNYQTLPLQGQYPYGYPPQQPFENEPNNRMYPEFYQVRPNRQWQWPLQQYFPIIIRDPVQQIVNAFTSMVEYGEQANANCGPQSAQSKNADGLNSPNESVNLYDYHNEDINAASRTSDDLELPIEENLPRLNSEKAKSMDDAQQLYSTESTNTEQELETEISYKNTENVEPGKLAHKFNMHEKKEKPKNNANSERVKQKFRPTITKHVDDEIAYKNLDSIDLHSGPLKVRPETKFFNPLGMQQEKNLLDSHKQNEDIKIFSKDNTGNGIFIHRLKVNHGGVAIAGPGGVATAGHGGTAIVGPNGIAFTQPDSIAIAGVGAKVVAVNPDVNLTKLIESTGFNRNNFSSRIGKVVAIGPVIYYNKG